MEGTNKCQCNICKRSRAFKEHLENVTTEESKEFFQGIFNWLYEVEEDLDIYKHYNKNLSELYPQIFKEIRKCD